MSGWSVCVAVRLAGALCMSSPGLRRVTLQTCFNKVLKRSDIFPFNLIHGKLDADLSHHRATSCRFINCINFIASVQN